MVKKTDNYDKGDSHFTGSVQAAFADNPDVHVVLMQRRNSTFFMRVRVRSHVKPLVWTEYEVDLDRYENERDFLKTVGIAAAAAVEHQYTTYGDKHNETEVIRAAIEAAVELMRDVRG